MAKENKMKNLDKHEWDITPLEKDAISKLEGQGFEVIIKKRTVTKDIATITRDGFGMDIDIPVGAKGIRYGKYVAMVDKTFKAMQMVQ